MSVTTTDNARVTTLRHTLADYDLHHNDPAPEEAASAPAPNAHDDSEEQTGNPEDWPTDRWRRVPAYRPVRHQRDDQRDTYQNAIERNFVRVMFGGVYAMARTSQIWRSTGGRFNSDYFVFKIGGEW